MPNYELVDPGTGSATFGAGIAVLANGNTVVTSSGDSTAAAGAGAVFVFNTTTVWNRSPSRPIPSRHT